jgi:acetyl esterase/lipase
LLSRHPLPTGYEDCFRALKWVVSDTRDTWLLEHDDLARVILAGGNIVHNIAMMAVLEQRDQGSDVVACIERAALLHAAFGVRKLIAEETPESMARREKLSRTVCRGGGRVRRPVDEPLGRRRAEPAAHAVQ